MLQPLMILSCVWTLELSRITGFSTDPKLYRNFDEFKLTISGLLYRSVLFGCFDEDLLMILSNLM